MPVKASTTEGLAVVRPAARSTWAAVTRKREKNSSESVIFGELGALIYGLESWDRMIMVRAQSREAVSREDIQMRL